MHDIGMAHLCVHTCVDEGLVCVCVYMCIDIDMNKNIDIDM